MPFMLEPSINPDLDIGSGSNSASGVPEVFNGYFDVYKDNPEDRRKVKLVQRPLLTTSGINLNAVNTADVINGMISSLDRTTLTWVQTGVGGPYFRYFDGTTTALGAGLAGWSNTQGTHFDYLDNISYGANNEFVATDFNKGVTIAAAGGAWTEIVAATYTGLTSKTNILPFNGYLYCGSGTTNRIYNSNLNVPATWGADAFVTSASTPGKLLWLGKIRNYLIAFKQYSIEFWEDVGNPAPGSPLEAQPQLHKKVGLYAVSSIKEVSDGIIFAGLSITGKISMYKLSKENLSLTEIASPQVKYALNNSFATPGAFGSYFTYPKSSVLMGCSQVIPYKNKEFYTIVLYTPITASQTLVYDNDLNVWTRWFSKFGSGTTDNFYLPSQCVVLKTDSAYLGPVFAVNYHGTGTTFAASLQKYQYHPFIGDGCSFGCTTDFLDLGTGKRKFLDSLEVIYELESATATSSLLGQLNMQAYEKSFRSTAFTTRSVKYDGLGQARIIYRQLGPFRSKAFSFSTDVAFPTAAGSVSTLTLLGLEFTYNDGETDQS